ncbi:6,7-dimethyl-8-ribityllumazine synthase [bacterium SM23_57]|nr:MAG: 6,7-dimethyl-8-ribityllumazine synthase [bacterium SM23_57]
MSPTIQGSLIAADRRFGIVVSRFNEFISNRLLEGSLDCLIRHGADEAAIDIIWVPGSFEIPVTASQMAASGKYHAVICLGALIRGDTPHFDLIAAEVTKGIAQVSLNHNIPAVFGIITADSLEQAIERAGTKSGNKGFMAAQSAIEMADLWTKIKK